MTTRFTADLEETLSDTTRKYPRSVQEAFPGRSADYGCSITRPYQLEALGAYALALVIVGALLSVFLAWWNAPDPSSVVPEADPNTVTTTVVPNQPPPSDTTK